MSSVFEKMIEPGLKFIPVLDVVHCERHGGVTFSITQTVNRNVYNEFDGKLSKYLAATTGAGFPSYKVTVKIIDSMNKNEPQFLDSTYHDSMPHALMAIAERAVDWVGPIELMLQRGDCKAAQKLPVYCRRGVDSDFVKTFQRAIGICNHLGAAAFLDLSGEFDVVTITPPGGLDPVVLRLHDDTVEFPSLQGPTVAPFEWTISEFAERASNCLSAQRYAENVRRAIAIEKEAAILAFRSAAEEQIHEFNSALGGRPLEDHWLKSATMLTVRLRAGLGDSMAGISESARGQALDLCADIQAALEAKTAAFAQTMHVDDETRLAMNGSADMPRATHGNGETPRAKDGSGEAPIVVNGSGDAQIAVNGSGHALPATNGNDQALALWAAL